MSLCKHVNGCRKCVNTTSKTCKFHFQIFSYLRNENQKKKLLSFFHFCESPFRPLLDVVSPNFLCKTPFGGSKCWNRYRYSSIFLLFWYLYRSWQFWDWSRSKSAFWSTFQAHWGKMKATSVHGEASTSQKCLLFWYWGRSKYAFWSTFQAFRGKMKATSVHRRDLN